MESTVLRVQRRNLLLVDGDPIVHALVSHQLEGSFACAQASSRARAQELLKSMLFDVVLIGLAGEEGFQLINYCHVEIDQPALAILYLTGSPSTKKLLLALETGATGFLSKPLDLNFLEAHLEYAIAGARKSAGLTVTNRRKR